LAVGRQHVGWDSTAKASMNEEWCGGYIRASRFLIGGSVGAGAAARRALVSSAWQRPVKLTEIRLRLSFSWHQRTKRKRKKNQVKVVFFFLFFPSMYIR